MFGVAVGDALGAAFEGTHSVDGKRLLHQERATTQLRHTDDTALTPVLARHLADILATRMAPSQ